MDVKKMALPWDIYYCGLKITCIYRALNLFSSRFIQVALRIASSCPSWVNEAKRRRAAITPRIYVSFTVKQKSDRRNARGGVPFWTQGFKVEPENAAVHLYEPRRNSYF